ncbi:core-2/I-branching beta-1,6-N-acetylglucosaminyltransferase family protein [Actinidia rufa]|uniref:Core-2/I-branching beta-1,6-N-acetylglucosaminyltransferase family protein n=1 Tax=Actinidia rufa TaxID=165716 RepID=A0A7J0G6B7_9ERIC|nr:core-2/I-branching beta-1,6-N-acetylglucosaminyltransferase family protein [Actinidia rufa]
MTKKTSLPSISTRHVFRFGLKLAISLSISLCVFALLRIQYDSQSELYSSSSVHRRSRVSSIGFEGPPKIAFLFLARRDLPIDFLWGSFFEVGWGEASMIQAERLLLEAALEDPANQRFVLLSDSFLDKKEGRYNPKMSPVIPKKQVAERVTVDFSGSEPCRSCCR